MIYLYGLLEPGCEVPEALTGLDGVTGPVDLTPLPQGTLIHGAHDGTEIRPKRRYLLAHTKVLETAASDAPVLPMRFGMWAKDVAEVADLLDAREGQIVSAFDRIRGQVELGLRIDFPREAALFATLQAEPALAAERDKLMAARTPNHFAQAEFGRKLAERLDARRGAAQKELLAWLRPQLTSHVLGKPESDVQVLAADVLIPADQQQTFAAAVEALAAVCDFAPGAEPQIRLIGPVPPFNFVKVSLSPHRTEAA
ncbi:putative gas vesicle synthesis protein [Rhodovulum sp. P5]|uniref:GvpL/GvpF family gas vesicle protein n=1 Tax=Rhodovulum sp. P5 TaxID=1564506 RepID=UPI0009C27D06|nr:GvpL/GvpF family gas vesicle protein [Rhodovulum sp. P5]ARE42204.1 putative gas vesicle synthesis protein [Rhodovulum sp. P5]